MLNLCTLFHGIQHWQRRNYDGTYYHFDENYGVLKLDSDDQFMRSWVDSCLAHSIQVGNISQMVNGLL